VTGAWTLPELADLLEQWIVAGWQNRPHDGLRHPQIPGRAATPNEMYAAMVGVCGYVPLLLTGADYLELLPVTWRAINEYGIRVNHRTYDCTELNAHRRQHSGHTDRRGLWEVHHDPYDCDQVWLRVRATGEWITVPWTHRGTLTAPFAEFSCRPRAGSFSGAAETPPSRPRSRGCSTSCSPAPAPTPIRTRAPRPTRFPGGPGARSHAARPPHRNRLSAGLAPVSVPGRDAQWPQPLVGLGRYAFTASQPASGLRPLRDPAAPDDTDTD
jgi:hypothetical protein